MLGTKDRQPTALNDSADFTPHSSSPGLTRRSSSLSAPAMRGWLYILANKRNGTIYVGVTSSLRDRIQQHKDGSVGGSSSRYRLTRLVYVEEHALVAQTIQRESNIKHWPRKWKLELIERVNPDWRDLSEDMHLV